MRANSNFWPGFSLQAGHPPRQFLERDDELDLGELLTDAGVNSVAECEVLAGILAMDVEVLRIGEHRLVAIGGPISSKMFEPFGTGTPPIDVSFSALRRHATIEGA